MPRYALLIAYEGRDFVGWWLQPGRRSVSGEIQQALQRLGEPGDIIGASRTDSGVHAMGQVAHLDCHRTWDPAELHRQLDHHLPPIAVVVASQRYQKHFTPFTTAPPKPTSTAVIFSHNAVRFWLQPAGDPTRTQ